jgi:hypothetical protein
LLNGRRRQDPSQSEYGNDRNQRKVDNESTGQSEINPLSALCVFCIRRKQTPDETSRITDQVGDRSLKHLDQAREQSLLFD